MKTTKFAVAFALCSLMAAAGLSEAQQQNPPSKAPAPKPMAPAPAQPMNPAPGVQPANKGAAPAKAPEMKAPSAEDMQKMFAEMGSLAKEHAYLKQYIGAWTTDVTYYEGDQETKSTGSATFKEVFGGRFIMGDYKGDMMGMPFEGHMMVGFNKMEKKFESFWIDNMSTGFYVSTGTADSAGKVITTSGMMDDPMTGGKSKMREITTFDAAGTMTFEMFGEQDGKEAKMMKIVYTKTTGAAKPTAEGHGAAPATTKPVEKK